MLPPIRSHRFQGNDSIIVLNDCGVYFASHQGVISLNSWILSHSPCEHRSCHKDEGYTLDKIRWNKRMTKWMDGKINEWNHAAIPFIQKFLPQNGTFWKAIARVKTTGILKESLFNLVMDHRGTLEKPPSTHDSWKYCMLLSNKGELMIRGYPRSI